MKNIKRNINTPNKVVSKKEVAKSNELTQPFNQLWIFLILAVITSIVYANSISNGYAYNDELNVLSNPNLNDIHSVFSFGSKVGFFETTNFPLTKFIFFIENAVFGFNSVVSHIISLMFFIGAVLLVFRLLINHFFSDNIWLAFLITILFSIHPIHTEVVNNIQNRGEIIAFLFSILTIDLFITGIKNSDLKYMLVALIALICALLSSPFSLISILTVVFYVIFFQQEKLRSIAFISTLAALFLSIIFFVIIYKKMAATIYFVQNPIVTYTSFIDKFSLICMSVITYLKLLLLPVRLSFYYGYNTIALNNFIVFVAILLHGLLIFGFGYFLKKNRNISFFIGFYLISILFYINVFFPYPGIVSERAMLFSSLPFCVLLVLILDYYLAGKNLSVLKRPALLYAFMALACLYAIRSIARNMDWKDTITLMTNDITHLENSVNANYQLADQNILAYNADGNNERKIAAELQLKKCLEILPDYSLALSKLGYFYSMLNNDTLQGLDYMQKAYKVNPNDANIVSNLALGYTKVANPDSALSLFKKAIAIDSNNRWSYYYTAQLLFDNGKQQEAFEKNAILREKFPENELAYLNYGTFYFRNGKEDSSIINFELAVKYGSKNKGLINHLYSVFSKKGDMEKAAYYESLLNEN
jgi:tetratricopeptide (TPR) repeat protein